MCSYLKLHVVQIQIAKASFILHISIDFVMPETTFSSSGLEITFAL